MKIKNLIYFSLLSVLIALALYFFLQYLPAAFAGYLVPNPVMFDFGNLSVRWYGFIIACAALIAYFISERRLKKISLGDKADQIIFSALIVGIIGARIGFVVQNVGYYLDHVAEIFQIWQGGLSIHGAMLGGILALVVCARMYKTGFIEIANAIAPQIMLAGGIGRFGNFFNQEIIGQPLDKYFWKMYVANMNRPAGFENQAFYHPVFLYESILLLGAFALYYYLGKKWGNKFGFAYTVIAYGLVRIIVEPFRIDYSPMLWKLDLAQIASLAIIILGVAVLVCELRLKRRAD